MTERAGVLETSLTVLCSGSSVFSSRTSGDCIGGIDNIDPPIGGGSSTRGFSISRTLMALPRPSSWPPRKPLRDITSGEAGRSPPIDPRMLVPVPVSTITPLTLRVFFRRRSDSILGVSSSSSKNNDPLAFVFRSVAAAVYVVAVVGDAGGVLNSSSASLCIFGRVTVISSGSAN